MGQEKLLTVREVSILLGISEKEILDLAQAGVIPAYKVGGVFLRFKREQVIDYQKSAHPSLARPSPQKPAPISEKIGDFFYYYDFYIIAALAVFFLLAVISRG